MSSNPFKPVNLARQQPYWKVSAEGSGHFTIHRAEKRGWGYVDYAFTIEQARKWLDEHADVGDTTVWEV